jgi:hypothetical protein
MAVHHPAEVIDAAADVDHSLDCRAGSAAARLMASNQKQYFLNGGLSSDAL